MQHETNPRFLSPAHDRSPTTRAEQAPDPVDQALAERHVEQLTAVLRKYFKMQRDTLPEAAIRKLLDRRLHKKRSEPFAQSPREDADDIVSLLQDWLDSMAESILADLYDALTTVVQTALTDALTTWFTQLSLPSVVPDGLLDRARAWAREQCDQLIAQLNETTTKALAEIVLKGADEELSADQVLLDLVEYYDEQGETWILPTAWWLAHNAQGRAHYLAALALGATYKQWFTHYSPHTCGVCIANEEQGLLFIRERFASGHFYPPVHLWCRCHIEYYGVTRQGALEALGGP